MSKINKILTNINEKYYDTVKSRKRGNAVEVFKNPDHRESREALVFGNNNLRFIVYDKSIYMWDAEHMYFHEDFVKHLGISLSRIDFGGILYRAGGRLTVKKLDYHDKNIDRILNGDFDWLSKYNVMMDKFKEGLENGNIPRS